MVDGGGMKTDLPFDEIEIANVENLQNVLGIAFLWHGEVLAKLHVDGAWLKSNGAAKSIHIRGIEGRQWVDLSAV